MTGVTSVGFSLPDHDGIGAVLSRSRTSLANYRIESRLYRVAQISFCTVAEMNVEDGLQS